MTKPIILITRKLPPAALDGLGTEYEIRMPIQTNALTQDKLLDQVRGVDALLALGVTVDASVCAAAAGRCRIFANYGVGYNNVDVAAATAKQIWVTNTPDVVTAATADLAWALMLATARRVVACDHYVRSGSWRGWDPFGNLGLEISGKTLGIIGAGRIGQAVATRAKGFAMDILYTGNSPKPQLEAATGARFVSLDKLLAGADFISLHVPLTNTTRHIIGEAELAKMKQTAILINTARGPVVDEKALAIALKQGVIGGAGLDVFEQEPQVEPDLLELDNVVLTPHVGTSTMETRIRMAQVCIRNIKAALRGEVPPNCLNPAARTAE